jgi:hypothetical protein
MGGVIGALFRGGGHRREMHRAPMNQPGYGGGGENHRRAMLTKKYSYIPDNYQSLDQVDEHDEITDKLTKYCDCFSSFFFACFCF